MIGFAGLSHLGIVSSIAAAAKGFDVVAFDPDADLIANLRENKLPVFEPDLDEQTPDREILPDAFKSFRYGIEV